MIPHQQVEPGGAESRSSKAANKRALEHEAVKYKSYSRDSDPVLLAKVGKTTPIACVLASASPP